MNFEIQEGRIKKPFNLILYGVPGIGKSTFASNAPNPLFLGAEENDELYAKRLPIPESFDQFISQLKWVIQTKPQCDTIVIDSIDSIERLLHTKVLSEDPSKPKSMAKAHSGYGNAYLIAERYMGEVRDLLRTLRDEQNKNIIILAHSNKTQATDTILGMMYDTYELDIHKKAQAVFVDWVSCVLFGNYVNQKVDDENSDKVFAIGLGERVMLTEKRPGFLAKNRYQLPYQMPLEFGAFYEAYTKFFESAGVPNAEALFESCKGMTDNISDMALRHKVLDSLIENKTNVPKLLRIQTRIQQLVEV